MNLKSDLRMIAHAMAPHNNPSVEEEKKRFPRGKARVVLFIDDLDRCPPEKVIDVIEALHLLLDKTSLFVAVVSVDVRYATRALEKKYSGVLMKHSAPSGIEYLQKIIQLPFAIPAMTPETTRKYFEAQLPKISVSKSSTELDLSKAHDKSENQNCAKPKPGEPKKDETKSDDYVVSNEQLGFTSEEIDVIAKASKDANSSPRSARLLANVFSMLKLIWHRGASELSPEVKEAIVRLLCMASSYPSAMGRILFNAEASFGSGKEHTSLDFFMKKEIEKYSTLDPSYQKLRRYDWGEIQLSDIGYTQIRLLRSFLFVGDLSTVPGFNETVGQKANAVRIFRMTPATPSGDAKSIIYETTVYIDDIPQARTGLDLLKEACRVSQREKSPLFQIENLTEKHVIRYKYNDKNPARETFKQLSIDEILGGDGGVLQIEMNFNVEEYKENAVFTF